MKRHEPTRCTGCGLPIRGAPRLLHIRGFVNSILLCGVCDERGQRDGLWDFAGCLPPSPQPASDDDEEPLVFSSTARWRSEHGF